ncbi:MAG: hypothetical protein AAF193_02390, partial [Bacteroidota bacterium]
GVPAPGNDGIIISPLVVSLDANDVIPADVTVINNGVMVIFFDFTNSGTLINQGNLVYINGAFNNFGIIDNQGTWSGTYPGISSGSSPSIGLLTNAPEGEIYNSGTWICNSQLDNDGYVGNSSQIEFNRNFFNSGVTNNFAQGSMSFVSSMLLNFGIFINEGGFTYPNQQLLNTGEIYDCTGTVTAILLAPNPVINACPEPEICDGVDNDFDGETDEVCACTDISACNYDPEALFDDGSCLYFFGCTSPTACNYSIIAGCDDGSCIEPDGCLDSDACNYDPMALCDDGSCTYPNSCNECDGIEGCTYPDANNYDSLATCDNGSCEFEECDPNAGFNQGFTDGAASVDITIDNQDVYDDGFAAGLASVTDLCVGDFSDDDLVNATDLLIFLAAFGSDCE